MLSLPHLGVKAEQYIYKVELHVLRQENLDKKKKLNPGLDLSIFQGTGP